MDLIGSYRVKKLEFAVFSPDILNLVILFLLDWQGSLLKSQ
ncbi:hypothetical protein N44_01774 [Microcystis aeruginosa NIES-44]|uniref:Uncharacterized protein n=1 Tax=Microcystis aeruginosa NIES-44 TaxID=449439 RepID=A0A0A1VTE5_MICAE|nr:hypothetical protein N44_01774 [Microcystis aeruginosa NIES-44]